MRTLVAALAILVALTWTASARATVPAQTPEQILGNLAAQQTHSWIQDGVGLPTMMAAYKAGQRLYVSCGNVAELARELLREAGYPARVVQVITDDEFNYFDDGHLMTEVFYEGRWQLYDVDANLRAVDANGDGVPLVDQLAAVHAGTARWEAIAADPLYLQTEPDATLRALAARIFSDPVGYYQHVMGVALLPSDPAGTVNGPMLYHDATQEAHLSAYQAGWRRFATDAEWQTLTTTPDALPAPTPPPAPAPPPLLPPPAA